MNDIWYLYSSIILMMKVLSEKKYYLTFNKNTNTHYLLLIIYDIQANSVNKTLTLNVKFYWCNIIQSVNVEKCHFFKLEVKYTLICIKQHTLVPQSVNLLALFYETLNLSILFVQFIRFK